MMDFAVAVIGGGPYGLSVAAHLTHRGVDTAVFGPPMDTWARQMPDGMLLKSDGFATNLCAPLPGWTIGDYCNREGVPYTDRGNWPRVALDRFVEYGRAFQGRWVPQLDMRFVSHLSQAAGGGFELTLEDGQLVTAEQVVLAVGITHYSQIPAQFEPLGDLVTHAAEHRAFGEFNQRRVAVIGAGSSAVEVTGGLLDAGAEVSLIARREQIPFWATPDPDAPELSLVGRLRNPSTSLGPGVRNKLCEQLPDVFKHLPADLRVRAVRRHLGPMSPWWLRDKVLDGANVRTTTTVTDVVPADGQVLLTVTSPEREAEELRVDHVVCATGYPANIDRLQFIDEALRARLKRVGDMPELSRGFESSEAGMYFVGSTAAGTFGPLMRFVAGVPFATERAAGQVATGAKRRSRARAKSTQVAA
jgi:Pyridine nucleotide-disulphide oxidoreductase